MKKIAMRIVPKAIRSLLLEPVPEVSRRACISVVDTAHYKIANPDVVDAGIDPMLHFRRFGHAENRRPNGWFSESYLHSYLHQDALTGQSAARAYVDSDLPGKPRLVFVSHDATRTGAPAILLRLLEIFSESGAFECFSVLDAGGERLSEFQALSHTHVMSRPRHDSAFSDQEALDELAALFSTTGVFQGNRPVCALVNSAESSRIGGHLAALNMPVISLIHEIAAYYPPLLFEEFCRFSEKVIFPSQFVKTAAVSICDLDESKVAVRGQGLLVDGFGSMSREHCRRLLRETLKLEDDAFVVLNVGVMGLRKGADLFVEAAKMFLDRGPQPRPVYFVWYGDTDQNFTYAQEFVHRHDLSDRIRLMPSTPAIEQIFLGGDVFMLTARADPFPCVVHEAMACGLPVIAFREGGGAPELIGEDCGIVVGMSDLTKVCDAIQSYLHDSAMHDRHARNCIDKITRDWSYQDYHEDVYAMMRACVSAPRQGWPQIATRVSPAHLVVMHGNMQDLELLERILDQAVLDGCEFALIDGRFGNEIEETCRQLGARRLSFRIYQPTEDTHIARAGIVAKLLKQPRPQRLTMIDTLRYLSPNQLKPLPYPKSAIQTDNLVGVDELYLLMPYFDEVYVRSEALAKHISEMNPAAASRLKILELRK